MPANRDVASGPAPAASEPPRVADPSLLDVEGRALLAREIGADLVGELDRQFLADLAS